MKKLISLILALTLCLALAAPAMASLDEDELFAPLDWFGDWPDGAELMDWDLYEDDENATALVLHFVEGPLAGVDLFRIYTDQLNECGDLRCVAEREFDSGFSGNDNETDREILYRYTGREDVGTVTALQSGESCDFAVHQVWLEADYLVLILAWGEDFPIEIDPEDVEDTGASDLISGDGILPDAWAFFNEEVPHEDETISHGRQVVFSFDQESADAAYQYAELLQSGRFGLELTNSWSDASSGGDMTYYYLFDYAGAGEDDQVKDYADGKYRYADVILQINDWPKWGWCEVSICFTDALTVTDTGDRSTVTGLGNRISRGYDGPIDGSRPAGDPDPSRTDDSSGGHWEWQTVEKDCPSCVGGRCPVCNGTGTYRLYGEAVPCDRDCSACDGKGTITQQEYVFVND